MGQTILRAGVIGLGMGQSHIELYRKHPNVILEAIADTDPARLATVGEKYSIDQRFTDPEEMMEKANLDLVSVATPNAFHHRLTLCALSHGLHVLCEKPMAMNVEEAEAMRDSAVNAGKNLMINFSYRFSNMSYALKQQVDAGVVGDIYFGRTVWHRRRGMPGFGGWFGNKALAGGGPLIDLGVHRIDLALWLMGHPEPASVYGSTYNVIARAKAEREKKTFTVEDLAAGVVKFKNGATLMVEASWALNIQEREHMITSLYGTRGGLVQKNVGGGYQFTAELHTEENGNLFTKTLDQAVVPAPSSVEEFVNSILEERPPLATADEGVKVQKILEGIYRSAEDGVEVRF